VAAAGRLDDFLIHDHGTASRMESQNCMYVLNYSMNWPQGVGAKKFQWSPTGIARGVLLHAQVGDIPAKGRRIHPSRQKPGGLLLPGLRIRMNEGTDLVKPSLA